MRGHDSEHVPHCSGLWGVTPTDDTASDMVSGMRNEIRFMDVDVFRLCARCLWNYVPCRPQILYR